MEDKRFSRRLYSVSEAARFVGMSPSTLSTWAHGYERRPAGRAVVTQGPVITALSTAGTDNRVIPFIGLVEAAVVQAFRETGLPMQRIRRALAVLSAEGSWSTRSHPDACTPTEQTFSTTTRRARTTSSSAS
jgi:DNA-binding transcriptional regulator YdaS (Cro superfamily)